MKKLSLLVFVVIVCGAANAQNRLLSGAPLTNAYIEMPLFYKDYLVDKTTGWDAQWFSPSKNSWVNIEQHLNIKNPDKTYKEILNHNWDTNALAWKINSRFIYDFTKTGGKTSQVIVNAEDDNGDRKNRYTYSYTGNNLTELLCEDYNSSSGTYVKNSVTYSQYNSSGQKTKDSVVTVDQSNPGKNFIRTVDFVYGSNGKCQFITGYSHTGAIKDTSFHIAVDYYSNNKIKEYATYTKLGSTTTQLIPTFKQQFEYDGLLGEVSKVIMFNLDNNDQLIPMAHYTHVYDNNGRWPG